MCVEFYCYFFGFGVDGYLQVVGGVVDYDGMVYVLIQFVGQFLQYGWMWFGEGFIGVVCGIEFGEQVGIVYGLVQFNLVFVGGYGQEIVLL